MRHLFSVVLAAFEIWKCVKDSRYICLYGQLLKTNCACKLELNILSQVSLFLRFFTIVSLSSFLHTVFWLIFQCKHLRINLKDIYIMKILGSNRPSNKLLTNVCRLCDGRLKIKTLSKICKNVLFILFLLSERICFAGLPGRL